MIYHSWLILIEGFISLRVAGCEVWHHEARDVGTRDVTRHRAASRGAWRGHVLRRGADNTTACRRQYSRNTTVDTGPGTRVTCYLLLVSSEVRGWCRAGQRAVCMRGQRTELRIRKCHRPLLTSDVTFPALSIQCFNKMTKWIFYCFLCWGHKKLDVTSEQRISTEKNGHSH